MANKSFVVSYLIKARDRYSQVARRVHVSTRVMARSIRRAKKEFGKFSAKMRRVGAVMSASITLPIAFLGRSLKNAARDAEETNSKFATVFSSIEKKANAVAANLAKNYGLAKDESKELLSNTGDLLAGLGFSQEATLKMSEQVNKLAVDLNSFKNTSGGAQGASAALTKALLGERESLKTLGIAILEKDVKQRISLMLSQGHRFASLKQAKAQATLILAMEQSKNAIGDFARTLKNLANQERILAAKTRDLKVSFGKILLPMYLALTKVLIKVVGWFSRLSPAAKKTILIIAGIVAVVGPLLIALGSLILLFPIIIAGFKGIGLAIMFMTGPIGLVALAIVAVAVLMWKYWGPISKFMRKLGGDVYHLVQAFKKLLIIRILVNIFKLQMIIIRETSVFMRRLGGDVYDLVHAFGNLKIVRVIIDAHVAAFDFIIEKVKAVWEMMKKIGSSIAIAVKTVSKFRSMPFEALNNALKEVISSTTKTVVEVGVNVGLDRGLEQSGNPKVIGSGVRRLDVGLATAG